MQGNRVYVGTRTMGQGTLTLEGAIRNDFCTFDEAGFTNNARVQSFIIEEAGNFEIVKGVYNNTGPKPTLTRASVRKSKINNVVGTAKMMLGGAATVRVIAAAEDLLAMSCAINIESYGAVGDGITDNTAAIQNALNENAAIYVPTGVFLTRALTIPTTVKLVCGLGTLKASGSYPNPSSLLLAASNDGLVIRDITLSVDRTIYGYVNTLALVSCTNCTIDNVKIINGGRFGLYLELCINCRVTGGSITNCVQSTINSLTNTSLIISGMHLAGNSTMTGHTVLSASDVDFTFTENIVVGGGATVFGVYIGNCSRATVSDNIVRNTLREGIAGYGTDLSILNNHVSGDAGVSQDYGISSVNIDAANINRRMVIAGNHVYNTGISCVAVGGYCQDATIRDNVLVDPGALDPLHKYGIEVGGIVFGGGAPCLRTAVFGNVIRSTNGVALYAVREFVGADYTRIYNNQSYDMVSGFSPALIGANSSAGNNDADLGTPSAVVLTNATGTAPGLTAGNATKAAITNDTTGATMNLVWVAGNIGNLPLHVTSGNLNYNPATGNIASTLYNNLSVIANGTNTLNIAGGKTFTASNTMMLTSVDGAPVAFGPGGTVAYQGTITTSQFAANVFDTDATLAANSATRIPAQSAVKSYVDNAITGIKWKASVLCATTANITLSGEQTVDGQTTSASRVVVKNQTTGSQNGIYVSAAGAWTRSADADTAAEITQATVFVERGTVNADTQWTCSTDNITLGTTALVFAQVSGAGTYSAGSGLLLSGNQFSIDGAIVGRLATANVWALAQTFTVAPVFTDQPGSRTAMGLGTMATQGASAVAITGGSLGAAVTHNSATYPTIAQGDVLYGSAANTVSALAKNITATRYLSNAGASNVPAWSQVDVTNGIIGAVPVVNGGTGDTGTAWTTTGALTIASSGGALGASPSAVGRTKKIGKTCFIEIYISIPNAGSGTGAVNITLPDTAGAGSGGGLGYTLYGQNAVNNKMLIGAVNAGATTLAIVLYDASTVIASGFQGIINGSYEIA